MAIIVSTQTDFKNAISAKEPQIILADNITLTTLTTIGYAVSITSQAGDVFSLLWGGTSATNKTMLSITAAGAVVLAQITLSGNSTDVTLAKVSGGALTLEQGATVGYLYSRSANAGIKVDSGGTLYFNNGLVTRVDSAEAISITKSTMYMRGKATIAKNNANGLTLYQATLEMSGNAAITDNTGMQAGSGILCVSSTIDMGVSPGDAPLIARNVSPSYSGGIYLSTASTLTMRYNAMFTENRATTFAPAIGMGQNSTLFMQDNAAITNHQGGAGAGLWADNSAIFLYDDATIEDNESNSIGGGAYLQNGARLTVADSAAIKNNTATSGAGAYLKASFLELTDSQTASFSGNQAAEMGGGIFINEASTALLASNARLLDNSAPKGNGVYTEGVLQVGSQVQLLDSVFFENPSAELPEAATMPAIISSLLPTAQILLEESNYVNQKNLPLAVAQNSPAYETLTQADCNAFLPPASFKAGYLTYLNEEATRVMLGYESYQIAYHDLFDATHPNPGQYILTDLPIVLHSPSGRANYIFIGWQDAASNFIESIPGETTGNLDFYAIWQATEKLLSFNSNGTDVVFMPVNVLVTPSESVSIPLQAPLREGYVFVGWNTAADGHGSLYLPGDLLSMGDSPVTLYAQWHALEPTLQTIHFEGNNASATNLPVDITLPQGTHLTLPQTCPTCAHSRFSHWCADVLGTGTWFLPGDELLMPTKQLTLYAQWISLAPQYALTFMPNATGVSAMPATIIAAPPSYVVTLPTALPSRKQHRFIGWNTAANGTGLQYQPGSQIQIPQIGLTLFARWQCCNNCCRCR